MAGQWLHALGVQGMAQELLQAVEQLLQVLSVLLQVPAEDDDVIEVDEGVWQVPQDPVHQPLKCLGCISQAKRHVDLLKEAEWCYDGCLWHVSGGHWDLVVALYQIYLA